MEREGISRVEELFHEALDRSPTERDEFLRAACENDDRLRAEVDSLLFSHQTTSKFLDHPIVRSGLKVNCLFRKSGIGPRPL